MEWIWGILEKLDLIGNEIKVIDLIVFEIMFNFKIFFMDNNKLNSFDFKILNFLRFFIIVGFFGNLWECSFRICVLVFWLGSF